MKILILTSRYPPSFEGGGEISVQLLAELLSRYHEVEVLAFDGNSNEELNGVKIQRRKFKSNISGKIKLLNYLHKVISDYDIVHGYNMTYYDYIGILKVFCKTKIVVTLNNLPDYNLGKKRLGNIKKKIVNRISYYFMKNIDQFICLSETVKKSYERYGFRNLNVIPNFIDPKYLERSIKKTKSDSIKILYVGKLYHKKGVDILIKAYNGCGLKNIELTIVGDGPEMSKLKKMSKEVKFIGEVKHSKLLNIYDQSDIFVHPGRWNEPFGRTIIEAMSRGLLVIVSDKGAPPDIINDKDLIFKSEDYHDLAKKIIIYSNKSNYNKKVKYLKQRAKLYFPKNVIQNILDVYNKL